MVTVKDVAKNANVSLATVSRVINNVNNVSDEIRERVQCSVKELGYYPNHAARALVKQSVGAISIVLRNLHSPFFTDLIRGIEDGASGIGRNVFFCSLGKEPEFRDRYMQFLMNGTSDAIVIYGSLFSDQPLIEHLHNSNFPFLLIENNFDTLNLNQLLVDNIGGAKTAIKYLIENNHRKIAHFMGDPNKKVNLERYSGYTLAMQKNGLPIEKCYLKNTFNDPNASYHAAQELMMEPEETRPTAIFCGSDKIATGAIKGIMDRGFRVPEDISVVGFDSQKISDEDYRGPRITTISQPFYQMGFDGIQYINDLLDGKIGNPINKVYDTSLLVQDTVRKL